MTENRKEAGSTEPTVETTIVPGKNPFIDNPKYPDVKCLITNIGFNRGASTKYEVFAPIPTTDEQAKDFYDTSLVGLIEKGVRALTTYVSFKPIFNEDGSLPKNGHVRLQKAMDEYKVGAKGSGTSVKKKAAVTDELMSLWGASSLEELKEKAIAMQRSLAGKKVT